MQKPEQDERDNLETEAVDHDGPPIEDEPILPYEGPMAGYVAPTNAKPGSAEEAETAQNRLYVDGMSVVPFADSSAVEEAWWPEDND